MPEDIRYPGPDKKITPPPGQNQEISSNIGATLIQGTYANSDWLSGALTSLIATTNLLEGDIEHELVHYALPISDDPSDAKLKEAQAVEWPKSLGPPSDFVTYSYYKALELRNTS